MLEEFPCLQVKTCNKCGETKNSTIYFKAGKSKTCKDCFRAANHKRKKILWQDIRDKWNHRKFSNLKRGGNDS